MEHPTENRLVSLRCLERISKRPKKSSMPDLPHGQGHSKKMYVFDGLHKNKFLGDIVCQMSRKH